MNYFKKVKNISIVYFSGTGGTKRVASDLSKALDIESTIYNVSDKFINIGDMLILLAPVHAMDFPYPIYDFIKSLDKCNKPAIVISVSGGGNVFPNLGCRNKTIKKLTKKGFNVVYEEMIVMPSNAISRTPDTINYKLFEVLPNKINNIVEDLKKGVIKRFKIRTIDKFTAMLIGNLEKFGAKKIGKRFKANDTCTGCGLCAKNCSTSNIQIIDGKPKFSNKCSLCMKCMYICPNKSLQGNINDSFVLNDFEMINTKKNPTIKFNQQEYDNVIKKKLWKGLKEYIEK